ncbi:nitrate transporter [Xylariaceae sp. FL0594]|nr:nitrate transporter [Xylariaceae sp. FL0594]
MLKLSHLWAAPEINPVNRKARSIPIFNVWNTYGRVFFFSWFGFMVAFWAWYTFPPLITHAIKADLHLTPAQVANSNIVSLTATLLVRYLSGPLCDLFGPRVVFAGILIVGSIPLGLAPLVQSASGLYVSRFFIGILGGSFVPCQVWCTAFFDKNVVGSANALSGGWGNAGGGITYFIMPAVFNSFHARGYSIGQSWRLAFVVPLIIVLLTGVTMLLVCPDTPTGKWSERLLHTEKNLTIHGIPVTADHHIIQPVGDNTGNVSDSEKETERRLEMGGGDNSNCMVFFDHEAVIPRDEMVVIAEGETVQKPTLRGVAKVLASPQTLFHIVTYCSSFGGELAINSILSAYYVKNFPGISPTYAANAAAVFGFLNFATRPLGGFASDLVYRATGRSLWAKKALVVACGLLTGALLIVIGRLDPRHPPTMLGLVSLMAIFLEAGNGANFGLVPHVHPHANGIVSGTTGASGNLGGIVFGVIFRFVDGGTNYAKAFWIIGLIHIGLNLSLCWISPVPKGQIGGR